MLQVLQVFALTGVLCWRLAGRRALECRSAVLWRTNSVGGVEWSALEEVMGTWAAGRAGSAGLHIRARAARGRSELPEKRNRQHG